MNILRLKTLTKADKFLIIILLAAATLGVFASNTLFAGGGGKYVQVIVNGEIVKTISLREGYREEIYIGDTIHLRANSKESNLARNAIKGYNVHGYNIIEINSDGARVKEAECADLLCVKTGWVNAQPQQIVCLPNRVVIRIISDDDSGQVDDIAR